MKEKIEGKCLEICKFLLDKNKSYGNSAAESINVFSTPDPIEGVRLRMDDKIKRIRNSNKHAVKDNEDSVRDLIGYLILYEILMDDSKAGTK
jgi:hypothetical protein